VLGEGRKLAEGESLSRRLCFSDISAGHSLLCYIVLR
jgi:hypothetical protein